MVSDASSSATSCNTSCVACGADLPGAVTGRPRRYCNDACRKAAKRASSTTSTQGLSAAGSSAACRGEARRPAAERPPLAAGLPGGGKLSEEPSESFRTWYYANFASMPGQDPIRSRRKLRYRLRTLLSEVTTVDRCKGCGREPIANGIQVRVSTKEGRTTAGFGGLETCGRIWLCPVCSAKIRVRRGDQIAEGVARHLDSGGAAWFVTATLPHEKGDALKASFTALTEAWRYVKTGRAYQREKADFGILGDIKAVEVTHGENGWHPHSHILVLTARGLELDEMRAWVARLDARWAKGLVKAGWPAGKAGIRLTVLPVEKGQGLAAYITKVQEKGLGNEIARADMKDAREGNRTPFGILADFGNTGLADDLELWWEYEEATAGRSAIRWSPGLWKLLMPEEEFGTEEEIAGEDEGGFTLAYLAPWTWRRIIRIPGAEIAVLEAVEDEGFEGLLRTLIRYRISAEGVYTPEEWASPNQVDLDPPSSELDESAVAL